MGAVGGGSPAAVIYGVGAPALTEKDPIDLKELAKTADWALSPSHAKQAEIPAMHSMRMTVICTGSAGTMHR